MRTEFKAGVNGKLIKFVPGRITRIRGEQRRIWLLRYKLKNTKVWHQSIAMAVHAKASKADIIELAEKRV